MFSQEANFIKNFPFLDKSVDTFTNAERLFYDQLEWLQKLPNDYHTILDVGCGSGYHSKFFETMGHVVTACDKDDRFLYKDTIDFINCSIEQFPSNKKFDALFTSHVIEHVINLGFFFEQVKDLLNDGGYLFIAVPNSEVTENGHWLEGWSIPQLAMMLASFGFDCKDSFFGKWGYSTVGFGRKTNRPCSDFVIEECLPFLPAKFVDLKPADLSCVLYRNVSYVDNDTLIRTTQPWDMIDPAKQDDINTSGAHVGYYAKVNGEGMFKRVVSKCIDKFAQALVNGLTSYEACSRIIQSYYGSGSPDAQFDPVARVRLDACREGAEFIKQFSSTAMLFHTVANDFWDYVFTKIPQQGLFLEFGVFKGGSINFFAAKFPERAIHGFDSFEGLPEDWTGTTISAGGIFNQKGELPTVASNVQLHKGWFNQTLPAFVDKHKDENIAFMFVDCDIYSSAKDIFDNIMDNVIPGTVIVLDECTGYPGWQEHVIKAFNEFCFSNKITYRFIAFYQWKAALVIDTIGS